MRKSLPSRSLVLFCVVSLFSGFVPRSFAGEFTLNSPDVIGIQTELSLPSLIHVDGLTFRAHPTDQTAIQSYDFSGENPQTLVLPAETVSTNEQLLLSQDVFESSVFVQSPVDLPLPQPSYTPSPSPTETPIPPSPTPTTKVLPINNQVVTGSPSLTSTPTPTVLPSPTNIPTPTPTQSGPTPTLPPIPPASEIDGYFVKYSNDYHIDRDTLIRIARCESGFNAHAKYLDYGGMFQFSTNSWIVTRGQMGLDSNPDLRFSAEESIKTAAFKISRDGTGAWPSC